ncbi:MAG: MarR family transcriptional regulator [Actinomycetota bacterium]
MSKNWTFLGHHAHLLIALDKNPDYTIDELASILGITARSVTNVLTDLVEGGYLSRLRAGRRNKYEINRDAPLRHLTSSGKTVGELLDYLGKFK